jgi:hypothetical protein
MSTHPIQPVEFVNNVARFKSNSIVQFLLSFATQRGTGLNELHRMRFFPEEDWTQFTQLQGYSVSGARDLSFFDQRVGDVAQEQVERLIAGQPGPESETQARLESAECEVSELRAKLKIIQDVIEDEPACIAKFRVIRDVIES